MRPNFPHKLLLAVTQDNIKCSSANIKCSKTQLSKTIQSGGFIIPNAVDATNPFLLFPPFRMIGSLAKSYGQKLENKDSKEINSNLAGTGVNNIGKKFKKWISSITGSGSTLTNNKIKDIIKVIKSLEKRRILLKGTTKKSLIKKEDFSIFLGH